MGVPLERSRIACSSCKFVYDLGRGMVNNIMYRYGVGVNMFYMYRYSLKIGVFLDGHILMIPMPGLGDIPLSRKRDTDDASRRSSVIL